MYLPLTSTEVLLFIPLMAFKVLKRVSNFIKYNYLTLVSGKYSAIVMAMLYKSTVFDN